MVKEATRQPAFRMMLLLGFAAVSLLLAAIGALRERRQLAKAGALGGAGFFPKVVVDLSRPRDRKAMNHDAAFKRARNEVIEYLLGPGRRKTPPTPEPERDVAPTQTQAVAA